MLLRSGSRVEVISINSYYTKMKRFKKRIYYLWAFSLYPSARESPYIVGLKLTQWYGGADGIYSRLYGE